jgi:hypothetical protein
MKVLSIILMNLFFIMNCYSGTGVTGGALLEIPAGARPAARGEAFIAASDINSIYYNPAGLAYLYNPQVSASYIKGGLDTNYEYLAGVLPLNNMGVLGASIFIFQGGSMEIIDSVFNSSTKIAATEILISLAYAKEMLIKGLSLGITNKYLLSTLTEDYSASTYTFDIGAVYRGFEGLSLGVAAANILGGLKYLETTDSLPLLISGGAEYTLDIGYEHALCCAGNVIYSIHDSGRLKINTGLEYTYQKFISVRLGYKMGEDTGSLTFGVGYKLSILDDISGSLDYAYIPASGTGDSHKVSVNAYFGETNENGGGRKRKPSGAPRRTIR